MVHRALDVNANGTRMQNRGVCASVYYIYMAPQCGAVCTCNRYVRCGCQDADYAAHMRSQLVLYRMGLLWLVQGPYSYGLML